MKTEEEKKQAHRESQRRYREKTGYDKSKKQKEMTDKWHKKNYKAFMFTFNINTDIDVLEKLNQVDNINSYIKSLIIKDIQEAE